MADGFGTPPYIQAGPCALCGAENYPLSMGGPAICCACDTVPPERRVRQLAEENRQLRARAAQLHELYLGALGLPPDTPEMAAYQQASNELHDLTGD
jgi:hypothetical protein